MQVGHLFPRLLGQSEYNDRVKAVAPLMEAALRWWLAEATLGSAQLLRLMDATPFRAASPRSPRGARACTATARSRAGNRSRPRRHPRTPESPATLRVASVRSMPTGGRAYGLLDAEQGMGQ